ncbi:hypothetical protein [Burkholderia cepacia]|uniref:hypothetical protein n=1 Tax=Burkholderia cepacia TaxID=292 RepID=UPI0026513983|nr:hypothetical protein [Burkholderia cepacia]MDN7916101.1 hypothetical protein [Burkholderia cepacia]
MIDCGATARATPNAHRRPWPGSNVRGARQHIVLERGRAQPAPPVVGIAASILILGESATPIYFAGGAITIDAALCTLLRERRARA